MQIKEKFTQKLLVEGNDDQHVIWAICAKLQVKQSFDVYDANGIDNLIAQLPIRLKQSGIKTLGIVLDADWAIGERWKAVRDKLPSDLPIPDSIPTGGFVIDNGRVKFGVWIMPNNENNGMLEDFVSQLIPQGDPLWLKIGQFLNELEQKGMVNYKPIHQSKAKIHNWLALQEDPGTPMGLAITKKYLTTENEYCTYFVHWINRLFNEK